MSLAPENLKMVDRVILRHSRGENARYVDLADRWSIEQAEANEAEPYDHARYQRAERLAGHYLRVALGGYLAGLVEDLAVDSGESYTYVIAWLRELDRQARGRRRS